MREHKRDIERLEHMVHDYIHISQDLLWVTLTQDIPQLKVHIKNYYEELK